MNLVRGKSREGSLGAWNNIYAQHVSEQILTQRHVLAAILKCKRPSKQRFIPICDGLGINLILSTWEFPPPLFLPVLLSQFCGWILQQYTFIIAKSWNINSVQYVETHSGTVLVSLCVCMCLHVREPKEIIWGVKPDTSPPTDYECQSQQTGLTFLTIIFHSRI